MSFHIPSRTLAVSLLGCALLSATLPALFPQTWPVSGGITFGGPRPGVDVYMRAARWSWGPALILKRGETYRLHLSSLDVCHGFRLDSMGVNVEVSPDREVEITLTPTEVGNYRVICDEFCGAGHELMTGQIIVED